MKRRRTANEIGSKFSHAQIVCPDVTIHRSSHDYPVPNVERLHCVSGLFELLYGLPVLRPGNKF